MATGGTHTLGCFKVCLYNLNRNYEHRNVLYGECNGEHRNDCWMVSAYWAEENQHIEVRHHGYMVPPIRSFSRNNKPYLCRHFWKCDRKVQCDYAHSVREIVAWKKQSNKTRPASPNLENTSTRTAYFSNYPASIAYLSNDQDNFPSLSNDREDAGAQERLSLISSDLRSAAVDRRQSTVVDVHEPLNKKNYQRKFKELLRLEEEARAKELKQVCNGKYYFCTIQKKDLPPEVKRDEYAQYGCIYGMTGYSIIYAVRQSSGEVFIELPQSVHKACILQCNHHELADILYVGFQKIVNIGATKIEVTLDFIFKTSYFDQLCSMVDTLSQSMIERILPEPKQFLPFQPAQLQEQCLNDDIQLQSLQTIVSTHKSAPPTLLTGPFGSGKTYILVKSARYFLDHDKDFGGTVHILACTQQHVSANTFFECLLEDITLSQRSNVQFIRLAADGKKPSQQIDNKYWKTISNFKLNGELKKMLVVTTCSSAFKAYKKKLFPPQFFTHILLDEGAQMREPEAIAPLCLAHPEAKLTIAGDKHQVGPSTIVMGEETRQNGLATSIVERLQMLYDRISNAAEGLNCKLTNNHRCCKDIVDFCRTQFYVDQELDSKIFDPTYPFHFVCSNMELKLDYTNNDRICQKEAKIVVEELLKVYQFWPKSSWGQIKDCSQIAIMGSSRSQLSMVDKILQESDLEGKKKFKDVKRVPVYDIQGAEYRAIIIGTAEPTSKDGIPLNATESINLPQVFNTVISRARSYVVVVGDPLALLVKERHMIKRSGAQMGFWSSYIKLCICKNTFKTDHVQQISPTSFSVCMAALKGLLDQTDGFITGTSTEKKGLENVNNNISS